MSKAPQKIRLAASLHSNSACYLSESFQVNFCDFHVAIPRNFDARSTDVRLLCAYVQIEGRVEQVRVNRVCVRQEIIGVGKSSSINMETSLANIVVVYIWEGHSVLVVHLHSCNPVILLNVGPNNYSLIFEADPVVPSPFLGVLAFLNNSYNQVSERHLCVD